MRLQPISDRLRDQVPALRAVRGAASLAAGFKSVKSPPEACVFPLAEDAGPNAFGTMAVSQRLTERFAVVLIVRNVKDIGGEEAAEDLQPLNAAVKAALVGWPHPDDFDPCLFVRGRLVSFNDQLLVWQCEFSAETFLRAT